MAVLSSPPADALLPGALWVENQWNTGGTPDPTYPARIVLHCTAAPVPTSLAHAVAQAAAHPTPPHLWFGRCADGALARLQTTRLDRSAAALRTGGVTPPGARWETNKAGACIQVEIFGPAETMHDLYPPGAPTFLELADLVADIHQWLAAHGHTVDLGNCPTVPGGSAERYGLYPAANTRMWPGSGWTSFDGICTHGEVGGQDHWDTGTLDVPALAALADHIVNPPEEDPEMDNAHADQLIAAVEAVAAQLTAYRSEALGAHADLRSEIRKLRDGSGATDGLKVQITQTPPLHGDIDVATVLPVKVELVDPEAPAE